MNSIDVINNVEVWEGGFTATKTGLEVVGEPTFEQWKTLGEHLRNVAGSITWLLGDWLNYGETVYGEKYSQALEATNYEYQTLANIAYVCSRLEISRRRESLPFSHHEAVASLQPIDQELLLNKAEEYGWNRLELRIEVNRLKKQKKLEEVLLNSVDDTTHEAYDVIVIYPPWDYLSIKNGNQFKISPFTPKSVNELKLLNLPMAENCVVWLWATNDFLHDAFHLAEAWGLSVKSILTWEKTSPNGGDWLKEQTEHCLLCVKNNGVLLLTKSSIIHGKPTKSGKPEEFYDLVNVVCAGKKIEIYASQTREGWKTIGEI